MTETQTATRRSAPNPNVSEERRQQIVPATSLSNGGLSPKAEAMVVAEPEIEVGPSRYPPSMARALIAIARNVGGIPKLGHNKFHDYYYQKWEDVLDRLSPMLVNHGLLIQQNEVDSGITGGDQLLSITYEFEILNEAGEVWPRRPRWKAIARLKDNKGVYDDKAANKCHTQALKYFLINLFKIRTRDTSADDSDGTPEAGQAQQRRRAPDPNAQVDPLYISPADHSAQSWTDAFKAAIKKTKNDVEIAKLEDANQKVLTRINDNEPAIFAELTKATENHRASFGGAAADADVERVTSGLDNGEQEVWGDDEPEAAAPPPKGPAAPTLKGALLGEIERLVTVKGCNEWAMAVAGRRDLLGEEDDKAVENALSAKRRSLEKKGG